MDQDTQLERIRTGLPSCPAAARERKVLMEYVCFMHYYLQSKACSQDGRLQECYRNLISALHHWGRLAVFEEGSFPGPVLWEQVRNVDLGIYKLYEELTTSEETLQDRIQLVLLACEFAVTSELTESSRALLKVLDESDGPLTLREIRRHLGLTDVPMNLSILMNRLVERELVREVVVPADETLSVLELKYLRGRLAPFGTPGSERDPVRPA